MNNVAQRNLTHPAPPALAQLREMSARLGANPLLTQGGNGNTSIKVGRTLWIKGTSKCLADAMQEGMFVPVDLVAIREATESNAEITQAWASEGGVRPSTETPMHAVLPHNVVAHVHSINCIAWAVRADAPEQLTKVLSGLRWQWIPYVASGIPLAREVQRTLSDAPETDVWILGNHGLVVGGDTCESTAALLEEVERRLAVPPRMVTSFETMLLALSMQSPAWVCPELPTLHTLGADPASFRMLQGGCLYPSQAIYLGPQLRTLPCFPPLAELAEYANGQDGAKSFVIIEGGGVILNEAISSTEKFTLIAFAEVLQRIEESAPLRYLTFTEIGSLTSD